MMPDVSFGVIQLAIDQGAIDNITLLNLTRQIGLRIEERFRVFVYKKLSAMPLSLP